METRIPELVMPAGTLEKLKFACAYGANAVYAGIPQFSLRARTNSFTETQLGEGIAYAHKMGVRVYITLNIFAHNNRIAPSIETLRQVMQFGPDAVIMADPGLVMLARQKFPDLELHLSTQSNTMNWASVKFWKAQGIQRVILPRELSISEIKDIHEQVPDIDLEVFVHGAMCVALSGRCLLSGYFSHRDANLGICTNSCRWQYTLRGRTSELTPPLGGEGEERTEYALEEVTRPGEYFPIDEDEHGTYILNSRDLCAVEYLHDLWAAGVSGFKIEGRTKSVYYLAQIGRAYRKAIDDMIAERPFDPNIFTDIHATANRGLMPGFLIKLPDKARQNYELAAPVYSTRRFGGIVRTYFSKDRLAEVEVKNKLMIGDTVEFVAPQHLFAQKVQSMFDQSRQAIITAHGGGKNVFITTEQAVEPMTILRICGT